MLFIHHSHIKGKIIYFLVFLTLIFSFSCFHEFYKIKSANLEEFKETVNISKIEQPKYYVLHHGTTAMHLSNIYMQNGRLQGDLSDLAPERVRDPVPDKKVIRYKPAEKYILHEVHLFLKPEAPLLPEGGKLDIELASISEIQVHDKATGATVASHVLGFAGIATGIAVVAGAIALSSFSGYSVNVPRDPNTGEYTSCPYVYANNGQVFRLQGEIFAGAIFPNLERHDYLPLPDIQSIDDSYRIRISNEQKEFQHINLAELAVVEHPVNSAVLLDQKGKAHTISSPRLPVAAMAPSGKDLLPVLSQKDKKAYYFEEGEVLQNYVDMRFEKPEQATTAKLLLNTKESYWAPFVLGAYTRKLGSNYDQWAAQMYERSAEEIYQLLDNQGLRLSVYLWTEGKWQLVESINNVGPVAFRDVVVPIDLSGFTGDEIRVKVEAGHLFWEMDYASMDFTENLDVRYHQLKPGLAKASDGHTYTEALTEDDDTYLDQTYGGNQVTIWYPAPSERPGYQQSVFLHSKGHYEHIKDYEETLDLLGLPNLEEPGSFIEFSKKQFQAYLETNNLRD